MGKNHINILEMNRQEDTMTKNELFNRPLAIPSTTNTPNNKTHVIKFRSNSGGKSVTGTHLQTPESLPLHFYPPCHPQRQDRENGHRCRWWRRNPDRCFHFACSVLQGGRKPQPACKALQFRRCRHRADPGENP